VATEGGTIDVIAPPAIDRAGTRALGAVPGIGRDTDAVRREFLGAVER
jgi:hypothetical protein